jgi:hypothetical protein
MHRFKLIVIASALLFTVGPVSAQEKQAPPPVQQPTPPAEQNPLRPLPNLHRATGKSAFMSLTVSHGK